MEKLATVVSNNSRTNENGNTIIDGFSWAGCNGTEYSLIENLHNVGYEEFYYSAPYYWGYINIEELSIFTYTEGDTSLVRCIDMDSFIREINDYIKFLKESGEASIFEAEVVLKKVLNN